MKNLKIRVENINISETADLHSREKREQGRRGDGLLQTLFPLV